MFQGYMIAGACTAGRSLRYGFQSSEDCGKQSDDLAAGWIRKHWLVMAIIVGFIFSVGIA